MPERNVTIASKVGLHARPATLFVKAVSEQPVRVTIEKLAAGRDPVDASSILAVMSLGISCGDEVTLRADGNGADASLDALVELLATDLDANGS